MRSTQFVSLQPQSQPKTPEPPVEDLVDQLGQAMSIDDGVKYIVGTYSEGTPHDSNGNKEYLEACGFTKKQVGAILKKAKVEIDKNNLALANKLWIDYKSKTHKPTLDATVEGFRDSNTISLVPGFTSRLNSRASLG